MKISKSLAIILVTTLFISACATDEFGNKRELTSAEKGAMIGAGVGVLAGLGARDKKKRAIIYGIVGGVAGGAVGHYMDSQKQDFEKQLASEIQSGAVIVEKLPENVLMVTMTAQTSFDVDSSTIKPGFYSSMDKIAAIVKKYGKTMLTLVGHTDSTGSNAYNQQLSERRAASVQGYLGNAGVIPQRLAAYGMGEEKPRASNESEAGRALNRRVEIIIEPIIEGQN